MSEEETKSSISCVDLHVVSDEEFVFVASVIVSFPLSEQDTCISTSSFGSSSIGFRGLKDNLSFLLSTICSGDTCSISDFSAVRVSISSPSVLARVSVLETAMCVSSRANIAIFSVGFLVLLLRRTFMSV